MSAPLHWEAGDRAAYLGYIVTILNPGPDFMLVRFSGGAEAWVQREKCWLLPLPIDHDPNPATDGVA